MNDRVPFLMSMRSYSDQILPSTDINIDRNMGKKDNNEQKRQNRNLKVVNKDEKSDRETSSIMVLRPSPSPRAKLIGTITEPSKRRTRQTQKTSSSALIKKVFQRTPYNNIVVDFAYGKYLAAYKSAFPGVSLPSIADFGRRIRSVFPDVNKNRRYILTRKFYCYNHIGLKRQPSSDPTIPDFVLLKPLRLTSKLETGGK
ncbi:uncharacterized protein LOC102807167 [Saccoglossus kowalevskii]